jgi:CRISPR-associated protein Csx16
VQIYFVSRHAGAMDWVTRRGIHATFVEHLDVAAVKPGDIVIGTLPAHLAARICDRGARFVDLAIDIPEADRGRNLTADEMDRYGARLVEIEARTAGEFRPTIVDASGPQPNPSR